MQALADKENIGWGWGEVKKKVSMAERGHVIWYDLVWKAETCVG